MQEISRKEGPLVLITAGDLSGDMHAAHLVDRMRDEWARRHPDLPPIRFAAAGSDHLRNRSVKIWEDTTYWGAMGIFEGIKILPKLLAAKKRLAARIRKENPELIIPVDYRSFNMSLLKDVRKRPDGTKRKVGYYISPVLWWKPSETGEHRAMGRAVDTLRKIPGAEKKGVRDRFDAMADLVDIALVAYPFSLDAYERAGVNYKFIGHPLGEISAKFIEDKKYLKQFANFIEGKRLVCVAPGSRRHELRHHLPIIRELVKRLSMRYQDLWFYCPVPSKELERQIRDGFGFEAKKITFVPDDCYDLMAESDLMIVKSGTSVQIALILAVPAVTFYKIASEWIINISKRFFQEMPFYAFPNLLAGRRIVPELIQSKFTLENIYVECTELLDDPAKAGHMRSELAEVRKLTMKPDPIGDAATLLCDLIER